MTVSETMTRAELIERLDKGETGARLDAEIAAALHTELTGNGDKLPDWAVSNFPRWRANAAGRVEVVHDDGAAGLNWRPAHFSASLDDALALLGELLPRWAWVLSQSADLDAEACVGPENSIGWLGEGSAPTPAAALLIAILKAHKAKGEG